LDLVDNHFDVSSMIYPVRVLISRSDRESLAIPLDISLLSAIVFFRFTDEMIFFRFGVMKKEVWVSLWMNSYLKQE
jgi:hypothetical protein